MATNFLELATTLKYLGAKWLPGKKVNFTPWEGSSQIIIQILHLQTTSRVNVPLLPERLRHSYSPPSSTFTCVNFSLNVLLSTLTTRTVADEDWGTWVLSGLNQPANVSPPLISHVMVISLPDGVCDNVGFTVTAATVEQHKINAMVVKGYQKPGWLFTFCLPMAFNGS